MPLWQPTQSVARPAYYDRDAIPMILVGSFSGGPHVATVRATYTPAFLLACFVEVGYLSMVRSTVAGVVVQAGVYIEYLPYFGGSQIILNDAYISNVINFPQINQLSQFGYMAYGDTIRIVTFNSDTGGTINHYGSLKGTEFLY